VKLLTKRFLSSPGQRGANDRFGDASIVRIAAAARVHCHEGDRQLRRYRCDRNGDDPVASSPTVSDRRSESRDWR
jgi:hypothetical protein